MAIIGNGNLEADLLAETYWHTAFVTRPKKVKDGARTEFEDVAVYRDLPCAVSFTGGSTTGESDTVQRIDYMAVLFVRPEVDIHAGDKVIADVYGYRYEFLAGECARFISHVEVPLIRKDRA